MQKERDADNHDQSARRPALPGRAVQCGLSTALAHRRSLQAIRHHLSLEATTGLTSASPLKSTKLARVPIAPMPALGALKHVLSGCLCPLGMARAWAALPDTIAVIAGSRCRIQPGRSYPRPPKIKPLLHVSYKIALCLEHCITLLGALCYRLMLFPNSARLAL